MRLAQLPLRHEGEGKMGEHTRLACGVRRLAGRGLVFLRAAKNCTRAACAPKKNPAADRPRDYA
jgi:hypothetical protein